MNIVLSLLAVSVGHACPLKPSERVVAKVPAACYTMARTAAVEIFANKYPDDRGYVRNTDFARYAGDGAIYITVWVKRASQEIAEPLGVYVHADGLKCVIDFVND